MAYCSQLTLAPQSIWLSFWLHIGSLKSAVVELFRTQNWANTTNQGILQLKELVVRHLPAYHWIQPKILLKYSLLKFIKLSQLSVEKGRYKETELEVPECWETLYFVLYSFPHLSPYSEHDSFHKNSIIEVHLKGYTFAFRAQKGKILTKEM